MKLSTIYNIEAGILKGRIEKNDNGQEIGIFTKEHFDLELGRISEISEVEFVNIDPNKYMITQVGDVLVDSISLEATVITEKTKGLLVLFNYFVLRQKNSNINNYFFANWFNNSTEAKRQINENIQGTTIKKLNLSQLTNFKVTLPKINQQNLIGQLYEKQIKKEMLINKKIILERKVLKYLIDGKEA